MVTLDRLELPTHGLGNHCSIHLSYRVILAERVRFELTVEIYSHSSLAGKCNKPLCHLSIRKLAGLKRIELLFLDLESSVLPLH